MRARKYKNKLVALNTIREFLVRERRFPSRSEIAQVAQDNHIYDETWAPTIQRLSQTDPGLVNSIFGKLKLHLDIVFMYIQSFALDAADRFISNTVRLSRVNRILDHVMTDASDWARRVHDDNMCMIHRVSMKLMKSIKPGSLSGSVIDHNAGVLLLARHRSKRVTITDAKVSYSAENGKIRAVAGSTPSNILTHEYDTFFAGSIISSGHTGVVNIDLSFPHKKRFNIFDIDLIIPAHVMLYANGKLIADSGSDVTFSPSLMFRYITTDNLRIQIHQPGSYKEETDEERQFYFGIRGIALTRCEYVTSGSMELDTYYPSYPHETDFIAIESLTSTAGEVTFNIEEVKGGLLKQEDTAWTIERNEIVTGEQEVELKRGEVYYLNNTVLYPPKVINPSGSMENSVEISSSYANEQEDTSTTFGIQSVIDPIRGTKLWKFSRAAIAGSNKNAIIPGSMRLAPGIHTCMVQAYNLRRDSSYIPKLEDWHMDSDEYNIAIADSSANYRKWIQEAGSLVQDGIALTGGANIRVDIYMKSPATIAQNIIIYDIIGLQTAYYLDNKELKTTQGTLTSLEDMFKPTQIPIRMEANKWHKFTILMYSSIESNNSAWDNTNIINPWNVVGNTGPGAPSINTTPEDTTDISDNITQLYAFVTRNDIITSGIGTEMAYVQLDDLPFVSYPAYSMSDTHIYTNINIDKEAGHGSVIATWKEWKTGWDSVLDDWTSLMSMHNPAIVNSVDVSVNMELMEQGLSPTASDVVLVLGKKKAADPIIRYLKGDEHVQT